VSNDLNYAEKKFVEATQQWTQAEMAYEHSTKPQTLAYVSTAAENGPLGGG
jgi:hypothetical protein